MKLTLLTLALLFTTSSYGSEVKEFNKALIQDVQDDITITNQNLKIHRAPASVEESVIKEKSRGHIESGRTEKKNIRQTGLEKW